MRAILLAAIAWGLAGCGSMTVVKPPGHPAGFETHEQAEALWQSFASSRFPDTLSPTEARLSQLFEMPLDADRCLAHRAGLSEYLERVPVDLSHWQVAEECAGLIGDPEWQELSRQRIRVLTRYALRGEHGRQLLLPAPIVHAGDIPVLAEHLEGEVLWMRYLPLASTEHLLIEASLRLPDGSQERFYFDRMASLLAYQDDPSDFDYPGPRQALAFTALEAGSISGDALALTGFLNMDVELGQIQPRPARLALERAWQAGEPGGGLTLVEVCLSYAAAGCSEDQIERLVEDLKALDIGEAWALEAAQHLLSTDRGLDDDEVRRLLDQAGQRIGAGAARYYIVDQMLSDEQAEPADSFRVAQELLLEAAEYGHGGASLRLALMVLALPRQLGTDALYRQYLNQALRQNEPLAMYFRALLDGDTLRGRQWLQAATDRNVSYARYRLAQKLFEENRERAGERLLSLAALQGHSASIRLLAQRHLMETALDPDPLQAREWLTSGLMIGDELSSIWLSALYFAFPELEYEEDFGSARQLFDEILDQLGIEGALAVTTVLLDVEPFNLNNGPGLELIQELAERGYGKASLAMGERLDEGAGVATDAVGARDWYRRSMDQGEPEAAYRLGSLLLGGVGGQVEIDSGIELWKKAAEAGVDWAVNDLAWTLCTGQFGVERRPEEGLDRIDSLVEEKPRPHSFMLSTLAVCQAATGDFESARERQREALNFLHTDAPHDSDAREQMRQRMSLYREEQPYRADH